MPSIQVAVFSACAENEPGIIVRSEALEAALKQNNKTYQMKARPGVRYTFYIDTWTNHNYDHALIVWMYICLFSRYLK